MGDKRKVIPHGLSVKACDVESRKTIVAGMETYNLSSVRPILDDWIPLDFVIRNQNGIDIGGILAGVGYWGGLEIRVLWVREDFRNLGIGTWLLRHTEQQAREVGAVISMLDTFDFQAEKFYHKNGYRQHGVIQDFPKGHRRIYLSKKLE